MGTGFSQEEGQRCTLCAAGCLLGEGETGHCGQRRQVEGRLMAIGYGRITQLSPLPAEDLLSRAYPGSLLMTIGCGTDGNARCCRPSEIAGEIKALKKHGCIGAAYMYREPLLNWEFVRDTAREVRLSGMKNVLVTGGLCDPALLSRLRHELDILVLRCDAAGRAEGPDPAAADEVSGHRRRFLEKAAAMLPTELLLVLQGGGGDEVLVRTMAREAAAIRRGMPMSLRLKHSDAGPEAAIHLNAMKKAAEEELTCVTIRII